VAGQLVNWFTSILIADAKAKSNLARSLTGCGIDRTTAGTVPDGRFEHLYREELEVPGGSEYPGPSDVLKKYKAVVEASGEVVKGAKNPYTSRNGHMFSFLTPEGSMAIRLPDELADEFKSTYDSGPVTQYGSVMRGYVSVPDDLLDDTEELGSWFTRSYEWIGTLEPK
jgi:hypothetical protein